jgi:hypothetical protein
MVATAHMLLQSGVSNTVSGQAERNDDHAVANPELTTYCINLTTVPSILLHGGIDQQKQAF